jgi:2-C-methyl-D-erythritol 4-phosphate cytidylyltransferase
VLVAAYHRSGLAATDDAALVELAGHHVIVVEGDPLAFKVTTRDDLEHAERLLAGRARYG